MRLSRLPASSTAVARAVAVLGGGASLSLVARLTGLSEAETAAVVAALARAEVLRDEHPLGFVHPLVADAVYRDIPAGERQLVHDRAAHLLDELGASVEQVAAHLLHTPFRGDPWIVSVLSSAATRACERGGAPDAAAAYLERALQEPPDDAERGSIMRRLGRLAQLNNDVRAAEYLEMAYEATEDPVQRAVLAQDVTRALVFGGGPGHASRFAERARLQLAAEHDTARGLPPDSDEMQGLDAFIRIAGYMHDLPEPRWRSGPLPRVVGEGPGASMLGAVLAWEGAIEGIDRQTTIDYARQAGRGDTLLRADAGHLWVVAGISLDLADEDTGAHWELGLANAMRNGSVYNLLATRLWHGYYFWRRGALRDAVRSCQHTTELAAASGVTFALGFSEPFSVRILLDQGDLAGATAISDRFDRLAPSPEGIRLMGEARAALWSEMGRYREALESLDSVRGVMVSARNPAWRDWRTLRAHALHGLGRVDEALSHVDEEIAMARRWGGPRALGRALRIRAALSSSAEFAREAVDVLRPSPGRLEYGRALRVLASLSPAAEAVGLLREGADLVWRCDARSDYEGIVAALADLGEAPPRTPPAVLRLTTWERDVVSRHLAGESVRAIAAALLVTPQKVRSTIADVREILGAKGRADLRSAMRPAP